MMSLDVTPLDAVTWLVSAVTVVNSANDDSAVAETKLEPESTS